MHEQPDINNLRKNIALLKNYVMQLNNGVKIAVNIDQTTFTVNELAKYDGKNGNPAYVAVNGVIYYVTNNAAWAAATHFGLTAGRDLTNQFSNCHKEQQLILNTLPVVGRLI